ncbi:nitroreductase family protein [Olsenella sp. HMSC062G07]|uniref:nitroreductase family protein n=1 Tax=Olsenella sp. HMSC062G07 TaxID=1739330 RepID=UPI0008A24BBE|nr:nitroreductase family protein [Olsenella sp. HMSC062G07]OFK23194.1 nitroreductase [Olsenella sp. HMSC062G07]
MGLLDALTKRRSVYALGKDLPVSEDEVIENVSRAVELVPDAFDMKSARVVVALGRRQDELWDAIYDAFGGKVAREKIDGFKAGAGTVLYFIDESVVRDLQGRFSSYAENFPVWAEQANGMLQLAVWARLAEMGIGANLQHYNPVIDEAVRKLFDVPAGYVLRAQMVFGNILEAPGPKDAEDVTKRVSVRR